MMPYTAASTRIAALGLDAWKVSLGIAETMVASQAVIGARMAMLGAGLEHPGRFPIAEFSRLVPEKATAFGKANAGAIRALRGAATQDGMVLLDWWEMSIRAASAWWAPIHAQVAANARRLG